MAVDVLARFVELGSLAGARSLLGELERSSDSQQNSVQATRLAALERVEASVQVSARAAVQDCAQLQRHRPSTEHAHLDDQARALLAEARELRTCLALLRSLKAGHNLLAASSSASTSGSGSSELLTAVSSLASLHAHAREDGAPAQIRALILDNLSAARKCLGERLIQSLREALDKLAWPSVPALSAIPKPLVHQFEQLFTSALCLFETEKSRSEKMISTFDVLCEPIVLRFKYHFSGARTTNAPDRARWYMPFALQTLKGTAKFLDDIVQPLCDQYGVVQLQAKIEVASRVVAFVSEKFVSSWPEVAADSKIVLESFDDLFSFESELFKLLQPDAVVPAACLPSALRSILAHEEILALWVRAEREYSVDSFTLAADTANAWVPPSQGAVSSTAESFLTIFGTLTQHWKAVGDLPAQEYILENLLMPFLDHCISAIRQHVLLHHGDQTKAGTVQYLGHLSALELMYQAVLGCHDDLALSERAVGAQSAIHGKICEMKELLDSSILDRSEVVVATMTHAIASLFDKQSGQGVRFAVQQLHDQLAWAASHLSRPAAKRLSWRVFRDIVSMLTRIIEEKPLQEIKLHSEMLQDLSLQLHSIFSPLFETAQLSHLSSFSDSLSVFSTLEMSTYPGGSPSMHVSQSRFARLGKRILGRT